MNNRIFLVDDMAVRTPKLQKQVEEKVKANLCLIDDCDCIAMKKDGEDVVRYRGLCLKQLQKFSRAKIAQPTKRAKREFEDRCIALGLILERDEVRQIKNKNAFREVG